MNWRQIFLMGLIVFSGPVIWAGFVDGRTGKMVELNTELSTLQPGTILLFGEQHGLLSQQKRQMLVLQSLRDSGKKIHVGMEFLNYPFQSLVDDFRLGLLNETDFLKGVGWGQTPFQFYREQILFTKTDFQESTWAINAPAFLTKKVAQKGLASLSEEDKMWLAPDFALGRDTYRERFKEALPHLPNPNQFDNYFAAQSIWDDTMAWKALSIMSQDPQAILVIIVGEFHVQYGGGLEDRLRARGFTKIKSISSLESSHYESGEIENAISPSPIYGPRADFVWY